MPFFLKKIHVSIIQQALDIRWLYSFGDVLHLISHKIKEIKKRERQSIVARVDLSKRSQWGGDVATTSTLGYLICVASIVCLLAYLECQKMTWFTQIVHAIEQHIECDLEITCFNHRICHQLVWKRGLLRKSFQESLHKAHQAIESFWMYTAINLCGHPTST